MTDMTEQICKNCRHLVVVKRESDRGTRIREEFFCHVFGEYRKENDDERVIKCSMFIPTIPKTKQQITNYF